MKKLAVFLLTGLTCATMLFGCGSKEDTVETVPVDNVVRAPSLPLKPKLKPRRKPSMKTFPRKKAW